MSIDPVTQAAVDARVRRMIDEEAVLADKIGKLTTFIGTPLFAKLPPIEQELLAAQLFVMQSYSAILNTRLRLATQIGVMIPTRQ